MHTDTESSIWAALGYCHRLCHLWYIWTYWLPDPWSWKKPRPKDGPLGRPSCCIVLCRKQDIGRDGRNKRETEGGERFPQTTVLQWAHFRNESLIKCCFIVSHYSLFPCLNAVTSDYFQYLFSSSEKHSSVVHSGLFEKYTAFPLMDCLSLLYLPPQRPLQLLQY